MTYATDLMVDFLLFSYVAIMKHVTVIHIVVATVHVCLDCYSQTDMVDSTAKGNL